VSDVIEIVMGRVGPNRLVTIIDEADRELCQHKWHLNQSGYAKRAIYIDGRQVTKTLHRAVMERVLDRPLEKGEMIDHKDGDRLNNTRSNLRLATPTQNQWNCGPRKKIGYKGIKFSKKLGRWLAVINFEGKRLYFGSHQDPKDAAAAYNTAALKYYGEFARLNVIPSDESAS
jgi:hypothetical protein